MGNFSWREPVNDSKSPELILLLDQLEAHLLHKSLERSQKMLMMIRKLLVRSKVNATCSYIPSIDERLDPALVTLYVRPRHSANHMPIVVQIRGRLFL